MAVSVSRDARHLQRPRRDSGRGLLLEIDAVPEHNRGHGDGPGVGLEVGNSIYFDMPPGQFAYWNTDDAGRAMVRALIRSGHIDCLHSFGDLATTRATRSGHSTI